MWEDAPYHMSSGKCKLQQQDATMHLSEWPEYGTLTTSNANKTVEQKELSYIHGGNAKWYSPQFGGFLQN